MAQSGRRSGTDFSAIRREGIDVKLFENPILLTHKRLAHRAGVLAAVLLAALIGSSFLAGLVVCLTTSTVFRYASPQEAGKVFYGWTIGVEILVLIAGGFSRISRTLADDRKGGLWDSNRLTPLKPAEIVTGYWFGPALREFYMGAVLAGIGLVIVGLAGLPLTLWLGTQVLIFSTALFFGLLALLTGMAFQRPQGSIVLLLLLFFPMFSFTLSKFTLINFLLPAYAIVSLFRNSTAIGRFGEGFGAWGGWPELFVLPVPPILLSLGLQLAVGIFIWRAAVRKTANPFQPLLLRWEAIAIFALLVVVQHSLIWRIWAGGFPTGGLTRHVYGENSLLSIIHAGTMLVGVLILAFASPLPERVRVEALRAGSANLRRVFDRSAVSLALALALVVAIASLTQFVFSFQRYGTAWALATGNVLAFFLMFSLLLEVCRLRFKRRALGFVALWLFILCLLPFILAAVFSNGALVKLSFLAPGVSALADTGTDELKYLVGWTLVHLSVVVLLLIAWRRQWKSLLATIPALPPGH
jgi:hypothetical protein